ncbi:MAG: hypothetical protein ACFB6S_14470 [Geminicoccaceae bacterium]
MDDLALTLSAPFVAARTEIDDAFTHGFVSRTEADGLIAAEAFIDDNARQLALDFPGQILAVVVDDSVAGGFAIYPAATVFEADCLAERFGDGAPHIVFDPNTGSGVPPRAPASDADLQAMLVRLQAFLDDKPVKPATGPDDDDKGPAIKPGDLEKLISDAAVQAGENAILTISCPETVRSQPYTGCFVKAGKGVAFGRFLIDSGSQVSVITEGTLKRVMAAGGKPTKLKPLKVGGIGGTTTVQRYSGITMRFVRDDGKGGKEYVNCDQPVIIGPANIIGTDQLMKTGSVMVWDPTNGTVEVNPRPVKAAPGKATKPK